LTSCCCWYFYCCCSRLLHSCSCCWRCNISNNILTFSIAQTMWQHQSQPQADYDDDDGIYLFVFERAAQLRLTLLPFYNMAKTGLAMAGIHTHDIGALLIADFWGNPEKLVTRARPLLTPSSWANVSLVPKWNAWPSDAQRNCWNFNLVSGCIWLRLIGSVSGSSDARTD